MTADPRDAFDVTGRVAIVTGGGRGLGRSMSVGLAKAGARVVVVGRTQSDLDGTVEEIASSGGEAVAVRADVGDYDELPGIVQAAVDSFGGVDVLVNNAVYQNLRLIDEMTPEIVEHLYRVNAHGPTFLAQAAHPYLEASGRGSVINVVTAAIWTGGSGQVGYRPSKAALLHVSRVMAKEWAPAVRVNCLALGAFETSFGGGYPDGLAAAITSYTPLGRLGTSEEVVPHVLYLASDASKFVTGTEVLVDGGVVNGKGNNEGFKEYWPDWVAKHEAHEREATGA
jgi:NAD(P)-dependent dehydrogenase (short-subunit alcohol dehydrogenase family)